MLTKKGQIGIPLVIAFLLGFGFLVFIGVLNLSPLYLTTLVLGASLFVIAITNTDLALIILIFSMLLSPEFVIGAVPHREVIIRMDDIFLITVFLGWLSKLAIHEEFSILKSTPLNRPILSYVFIAIFTTFIGSLQGFVNINNSIFYIIKYIEYYLLFFMVVNNLRDMKQVKRFIFYLILVCIIVSLYALWLYFTGFPRVTAPFEGEAGEANTLAGYLDLMMGVMLGLILYSDTNQQRWILLAPLLFLMLPVFLFTLSRGGWLAFPPMYFTLIFLSRRGKASLLTAFIVGAMLLPFIIPGTVKQRIAETFIPGTYWELFGYYQIPLDESISARIESWLETFERIRDHPFLGRGVPSRAVIDNQYSRVLEESGLIGFAIFINLLVMMFRIGLEAYRKTVGHNFAQGLSLGYMAGFVGILTISVAASAFILIRIMEPFLFLTAVMVKLPELAAADKSLQMSA